MNIVYHCFFDESHRYVMNKAIRNGGSGVDLKDTARYLVRFSGFSGLKTAIRRESNVEILSKLREVTASFCNRDDLDDVPTYYKRAAHSAGVLLREIDERHAAVIMYQVGYLVAAAADFIVCSDENKPTLGEVVMYVHRAETIEDAISGLIGLSDKHGGALFAVLDQAVNYDIPNCEGVSAEAHDTARRLYNRVCRTFGYGRKGGYADEYDDCMNSM